VASDAVSFQRVVGQEPMKRALILNAIDPGIGGVLIRGERGTAKSTTARGLAGLMPPVEVVAGCRFSCDPGDRTRLCSECRARQESGAELVAEVRPVAFVELPLNASEDRVVGSVDLQSGITTGEIRFEPGLLARANRNVLYVDEVNLLDDHIVDVLLDAAAMGVNIVEREGVSVSHPCAFLLVGTMNPGEGELRPQLTDRFGLCVDVKGNPDIEDRVEIIRRATGDPSREPTDVPAIAETILAARRLLPLITLDRFGHELISGACISAAVTGHRADIVIARTAKALRALRAAEQQLESTQALVVTAGDIAEAIELGLAHRRRNRSESQPSPDQPAEKPATSTSAPQASEPQAQTEGRPAETNPEPAAGDASAQQDGAAEASGGGGEGSGGQVVAGPAYAGDLFAVRKITLPRNRRLRAGGGKRTSSVSKDRRGRYVRAEQREHVTDVALDATLRAAAPHQPGRRANSPSATGLVVEKSDLRQKVRRRKTGTLIVFVVDASASMDAEQRMHATKGAVLSLLRDAYLRRDKVALVVFSGRSAKVVLSPTSSTDLARSRLQRLGVGGTTPLSHGLVAGIRVIRSERLRDSDVQPLLVLISDGRGNISMFGEEPIVEAQRIAAQIAAEGIRTLIIDSSRDYAGGSSILRGYGANTCQDLADRSGGEYLGLFDLDQNAIVAGVERSLRLR
jgi:magnesium chelatase subunit D